MVVIWQRGRNPWGLSNWTVVILTTPGHYARLYVQVIIQGHLHHVMTCSLEIMTANGKLIPFPRSYECSEKK